MKWEIDHGKKEEDRRIIRDERDWIDALFPHDRSVEERRRNHYEPGKLCSINIEKI